MPEKAEICAVRQRKLADGRIWVNCATCVVTVTAEKGENPRDLFLATEFFKSEGGKDICLNLRIVPEKIREV